MNCAALPAFARNCPQEGSAGRRVSRHAARRVSRVVQQPPGGSDCIVPCQVRTLLPHGRDMYVIPVYFHGLFM